MANSEIYNWAIKQFEVMRGDNKLQLDVGDMKAVRELATRKFGYMMYVFEEVAKAYKTFIKT